MAKPRGYRDADSYKSKDPKKRKAQLLNLKPAKHGWKPAIQIQKKLEKVNIIEFATDKNYLNLSFAERPAQEVILRVLYALPLNLDQQDIFQILTKSKGKYVEGKVKSEAVLALGARAGKSFISSICALFEATRGEYQKYVTKGEFVYICIVATRELQARKIIQENCLRMLEGSPVLRKWIIKSTDLEITLRNYVKIISGPCNSTALRGLPIPCLILDEIAFYRIEGPLADETIFNSLRPRMAQFPNNKLFLISTAGAKQGLFYNFFNQGFRVEDRLTCQASTSFVNPVIPQTFLQKEKIRDPSNHAREFEALFSEKIESFFSFELIERPFTIAGDIKYKSGNNYFMGFDQSGLSGQDRFSLSIGHAEEETVIIDVVRSWTTKDLETILNDIKGLKNEYQINTCLVDRYAIGYVRNSFKKINLEIETRSTLAEIYVIMKSLIMQGKLNLPDRADLKSGMRNTLAVYNKSNQLSIYHERGREGHADELDSVACTISAIMQKIGGTGVRVRSLTTEEEEDDRGWVDIGGPGYGKLLETYHQI
ncbi:hypothetical protein ES705_21692 [subsurface metagenome]